MEVLPMCLMAVLACAPAPAPTAPVAPRSTSTPAASLAPIATASLSGAALWLAPDARGDPTLWLVRSDEAFAIPCDPLVGAWGMVVADVDGDAKREAIVALYKPARYDPEPHARLHVYGFEDGRCVPLWRGTRLAGRFDALGLAPDGESIVVHEWLSPTRRRIARYRWADFGFRTEAVLWTGEGEPPPELSANLRFRSAKP